MEILLDTANIDAIGKALEFYPIDGVTTNPSILAGCDGEPEQVLSKLRAIRKGMAVHVQTTAETAVEMAQQGRALADWFGAGFHLKIPVGPEGIKAVAIAKDMGLHVTVTAVFTPLQALMAAKAGADYVAPYVNRIDNMAGDGVGTVVELLGVLKNYGFATKVLGASFKNVRQICDLAVAGCHAVTMTPDLLASMVWHPYTDKSLTDFAADWKKRYGEKEITDFLPKGQNQGG